MPTTHRRWCHPRHLRKSPCRCRFLFRAEGQIAPCGHVHDTEPQVTTTTGRNARDNDQDGRALRIETVVNCPRDLGCNARLPNLAELQDKARACNRRILESERAGQGTVLRAQPSSGSRTHPSQRTGGGPGPAVRRSPGHGPGRRPLRHPPAATGITNKSLRALMAGLLHAPYTPGQMTYDLRRLRLAGLIRRIEHTNRYVLTPDGIAMAVFYTKLHNRLLRPLMAARQPQAPPPLRDALHTIDQHVDDYISRARLGKAA